jgi:hypothetical protein
MGLGGLFQMFLRLLAAQSIHIQKVGLNTGLTHLLLLAHLPRCQEPLRPNAFWLLAVALVVTGTLVVAALEGCLLLLCLFLRVFILLLLVQVGLVALQALVQTAATLLLLVKQQLAAVEAVTIRLQAQPAAVQALAETVSPRGLLRVRLELLVKAMLVGMVTQTITLAVAAEKAA